MKRLLERCAALDVHKKQVTVCVRLLGGGGEVEELMAEFSTMASQLLALRDWLKQLGVTHVAMEASGVYWKAPYYALEDDFEVLLVNASHVKNVIAGAELFTRTGDHRPGRTHAPAAAGAVASQINRITNGTESAGFVSSQQQCSPRMLLIRFHASYGLDQCSTLIDVWSKLSPGI